MLRVVRWLMIFRGAGDACMECAVRIAAFQSRLLYLGR